MICTLHWVSLHGNHFHTTLKGQDAKKVQLSMQMSINCLVISALIVLSLAREVERTVGKQWAGWGEDSWPSLFILLVWHMSLFRMIYMCCLSAHYPL